MGACLACGAEVITCLTPVGAVVDLEPAHILVADDDRWPHRSLFLLGAAGREGRPAIPFATPAIEAVDRAPYSRNGLSGPFRREHACQHARAA